MAAALPVLQAIGTVVSVIGALQQGSAASKAASYNAQVNQQNAVIARQNAADAAKQQDRENRLRLGSIAAAQGKSGGDAGTGSVLDVIGDVAAQGELQKQYLLYQGDLQARGYENTATLDTFSGQASKNASYLKAGSELLAGGVRTYDAYSKLNTKGQGSTMSLNTYGLTRVG